MNDIRGNLMACGLLMVASSTVAAEDMTDCIAGWEAQQAGKYMLSAELTSRCIANGKLEPKTIPRAWRNLGMALRAAGQPERAIEAYDMAIALKPDDVWNDYVNRGNAYSDLKQYDQAFASYAAAEQHTTNHGELHYNRGIVFERMNKLEDAKKAFLLAFRSGLRTDKLAERIIVHGLSESVADDW